MTKAPTIRIAFGDDALLPAFCEGFNDGFADYKYGIRMDEAQMVRFMALSGLSLEHSAVLLQADDAGWRGVGVALIALEDGRAWCSGLAVTPSLRGLGYGRRLMEAVHARVAGQGARTIQLEVLVGNTPARMLYTALGYRAQRDLLFLRTNSPAAGGRSLPDLHAAAVDEALRAIDRWQSTVPAWQRSQQAVARYQDDLWVYRMQSGGQTNGWAVCLPANSPDPSTVRLRIMALAVRPGEQQTLLAQQLLASLRANQPEALFSILNEPEDSLFTAALLQNGFVEVDRQVEMVLDLLSGQQAPVSK